MTTLADFNAMAASQVPALLRSLPGADKPLGDYLNDIAAALAALSTSTAAAATITIGGTIHAGDVVSATIGTAPAVSVTSLAQGGASTGTFTVAGTPQTGDTLIAKIAGETVYYELTGSETTVTLAAAKLRDAINANPVLSPNYLASSALGVVTVTAKAFGTAYNAALVADIGGAGSTTTLTASGANMTGGAPGDTFATLAAKLKDAINANAVTGKLVLATSAGAVITLTAKRKGTGFNATTLATAVTGASNTVTAVRQAATFGAATAGTGADDVAILA